MEDLQAGDRIELFFEDDPETLIRATVARLLTDREEGLSPEAEGFFVLWIEINVDEPPEMDAKQVVMLGTDFQYWLNGRRVTLHKKANQSVPSSG